MQITIFRPSQDDFLLVRCSNMMNIIEESFDAELNENKLDLQ